jgi:hypothetical protein
MVERHTCIFWGCRRRRAFSNISCRVREQTCEVRVSFSIRVRTGFQTGQMVTIYEVGTFQGSVFYAQTYAVQKCVEALLYIGYNVPSYSSMRISTLEVGLFDNTPKFCARLATQNLDDVVSLITYMYRFVVMSIYA